MQGLNKPTNVHPDNMKGNRSQFLAYKSRDMSVHDAVYNRAQALMTELFEWVVAMVRTISVCLILLLTVPKIKHYLPAEAEIIGGSADMLPGNSSSMVHPFLGFVVNMNVITRAHRDAKDQGYCLIIPLGSFTNGKLCLYEPGFVIPLQNGDVVIFPSREITHFNLHYLGERASLVFHTDREMKQYEENSNHWGDNQYFK
jgi:hypothetical protein